MKKNIKFISLIITAILLVGAVIGISVSAEETDATPGIRVAGQNIAYEGAPQVLYLVETKNDTGLTPKLLISGEAFDVTSSIPEGVTVKECPTDEDGNPLTVTANGKSYFAFFSNGISPKNVRVAIYATPVLVDAEGNIAAVGKQTVYSPWQYAVNRFDKNPTAAQLSLYSAMLNYAGAIQQATMTEAEILAAGGWADAYYRFATQYVSYEGSELAQVTDWQRVGYKADVEVPPTYNGKLFAGFVEGSQGDFAEYRYYTATLTSPGTTTVNARYIATHEYNDISGKELAVGNIKKDFSYTSGGKYATFTDVDTNGDGILDSTAYTKLSGGGSQISMNAAVTGGDYYVAEFDMTDFVRTANTQYVQILIYFSTGDTEMNVKTQFQVNANTLNWGMTLNESRAIKSVTYDKTTGKYTAAHKTGAESQTGAFAIKHEDLKNVRYVITPTLIEREYTYYESETVDGVTTTSEGEKRTCSYYAPKTTIYVNGEEKYTFYSSNDTWTATADATAECGYAITNKFDTAYRAGTLKLNTNSTSSASINVFSTKTSAHNYTINDLYITARSYNDEIVIAKSNSYDFEDGDVNYYKNNGDLTASAYKTSPPANISNKYISTKYTAITSDGENSYLQSGGDAAITHLYFDDVSNENIQQMIFETDFKIVASSTYKKSGTENWIGRFRFADSEITSVGDSTDFIRFFMILNQSNKTFNLSNKTTGGGVAISATITTGDNGTPDDTSDDKTIYTSDWFRIRVIYTLKEDGTGSTKVYAATKNSDGSWGSFNYLCTSNDQVKASNTAMRTFHFDTRNTDNYDSVHYAMDNTKVYYICAPEE